MRQVYQYPSVSREVSRVEKGRVYSFVSYAFGGIVIASVWYGFTLMLFAF